MNRPRPNRQIEPTMATDTSTCELCTPNDVIFENALAYVRYDNNSLSPGHERIRRRAPLSACSCRFRAVLCASRVASNYANRGASVYDREYLR
jgi:hypothetical protein